MRSKANFKGHPIHPMLVAFPIAFLCGALGFDAAGRLASWPGGWATGAYLSLAAIASGLVAAVPGLIDYLYVVPPNSSGRARATQHMLINVSALVACALGWAFRDRATLVPGAGTLLLEAAAVGLVTWGGWLGGTLVYRNQIGVDHRYARAGKWKEQAVEGRPGEPIAVAPGGRARGRSDEARCASATGGSSWRGPSRATSPSTTAAPTRAARCPTAR